MIDDKYLKDNNLYYADVGAKDGVYPKWLNKTKNFKSILFEPNTNSYKLLLKNKKNNEIIINSALSDKKERLTLNICKSEGSSSIFKPNYKFLNLFYNASRFNIKSTEVINANTLDNLLKINKIDGIDFLKIDVQGFELNVLKGSLNSLKSIVGIEVECEISQMYLGQPLFDKILNFLHNYNFHLFDIKRYYWKRKDSNNKNNNKGQLIFVDTLFLKQPESLINDHKDNSSKLLRIFYIYLYYGYTDLANIILKYMKHRNLIDIDCIDILQRNIKNVDKTQYNLPNFPGKIILKKIFKKLFMLFSEKNIYIKNLEWKKNHYIGNDHDLGN